MSYYLSFNIYYLLFTILINIYVLAKKLATVVEGDPEAPFFDSYNTKV